MDCSDNDTVCGILSISELILERDEYSFQFVIVSSIIWVLDPGDNVLQKKL